MNLFILFNFCLFYFKYKMNEKIIKISFLKKYQIIFLTQKTKTKLFFLHFSGISFSLKI